MYLDKDKSYFYQAYMADGSGHFYLELGLFGERTQHTSKSTIKARDEIQKISIDSTLRPSTQVKSTLYNLYTLEN